MELGKIYPKIDFPVSRGTPMISSLIKWDHSENHFVTRYEDNATKSVWVVTINISESDYEYVAGHQIDGKCDLLILGSVH
jgi:fatty acid synthase, animal type